MKKLSLFLGLMLALFLSGSASAADFDFGVNVDWNKFEGQDGSDWGVGARFDAGGAVRFMGSFDYYFVDVDLDFDDDGDDDIADEDFDLKFFEINGNILFVFPTEAVHPYLGGGAGIARRTFDDRLDDFFDDDQTEFGINALGGLKFGDAVVEPFIEVRGVFYTGDESFPDRFVVSGGILF